MKNLKVVALSVVLLSSGMVNVDAQTRVKKIGRVAEVSLVGISLYSPGLRVINKYGSPDEIQAITIGTGSASGGSGGGSGSGGGGGAPAEGPRGAGSAEMSPNLGHSDGFPVEPFSDTGWKQVGESPELSPNTGGDSRGGEPPLPGGPGGPGGRGSGGGSGNTTSSSVQYTKWVYKRSNARYSFVIDKYNRVVQIEAIGINDHNVKTSRGIKFGDTFKTLMNKYFQPDGYEIAGDSFVVKFLVRGKVAFRFSRLDPKKPHQVTGIVIAAGK